jgi:hypothetical protein
VVTFYTLRPNGVFIGFVWIPAQKGDFYTMQHYVIGYYNRDGFVFFAVRAKSLTPSNPIFCQPHTPQLLFVLSGKEVGGLLVIILQF